MLTKNDVKALKNAVDIVYRVHNGIGTMEAITQRENDVYKEQRTNISVNVYGNIQSAFDMNISVKYDAAYQTIASFFKEGDELTLVFRKDNHTNGLMEQFGLHGDSLELQITREKKVMTFLMETSCALDNSGRMIQA